MNTSTASLVITYTLAKAKLSYEVRLKIIIEIKYHKIYGTNLSLIIIRFNITDIRLISLYVSKL
jgi:hypothetical protein